MPPAAPTGLDMAGLAASVIRQSLIPMAAFYLIFMAALGLGLLLLQRQSAGAAGSADESGRRRGGAGPMDESPRQPATGGPTDENGQQDGGRGSTPGVPRGWPALIRHALGTAAGGYLLLLAVVAGYYYGIARVGGDFLVSAVTGPALLIVLATPVFAALSWRAERSRRG